MLVSTGQRTKGLHFAPDIVDRAHGQAADAPVASATTEGVVLPHQQMPAVAITMDFDMLQRNRHWRAMLEGLVTSGAAPLTIDCRSPRHDLEHLMAMVDGLILLG